MKTNYLILFLLMVSSITHSQVMLPAYQAVQVKSGPAVPTVTISGLGFFGSDRAYCNGNVTSAGTSAVTANGFCYSKSPNPTIENGTIYPYYSGTGGIYFDQDGFDVSVTYYIRAFATNSTGTGYSSELNFKLVATVGNTYKGGTIAALLKPTDAGYDANVQHGLIIRNPFEFAGYRWWGLSTSSVVTAGKTSVGDGASNTAAIIALAGTGVQSAAKVCADYRGGGYSDWYMPSLNELGYIYENLALYTNNLGNVIFWSSSQTNDATGNVYTMQFSSGSPTTTTYAPSGNSARSWFVLQVRSF